MQGMATTETPCQSRPVPGPVSVKQAMRAGVNAPVRAGRNHGGHRHVGVGGGDCEFSLRLAHAHAGLLAAHEAVTGTTRARGLAGGHLLEEGGAVTRLGDVLNSRAGHLAAAPEGEGRVVGDGPQRGEACLVLWVRGEVSGEPFRGPVHVGGHLVGAHARAVCHSPLQ